MDSECERHDDIFSFFVCTKSRIHASETDGNENYANGYINIQTHTVGYVSQWLLST